MSLAVGLFIRQYVRTTGLQPMTCELLDVASAQALSLCRL